MWITNRILCLMTALVTLAVSSVALGSATPFVIQEKAPELSITTTPSYDSKIVFRGEEIAKSSFELPVTLSNGNIEAGITSQTSSDFKSNLAVNYHTSYAFTFDSFFSLTPQLTLYTRPKEFTSNLTYLSAKSLNKSLQHSHLEPGLSATFNLSGIKVIPSYYYDMTLHGSTYEIASHYSLPLLNLGTELDFFAQLGTLKQTRLTRGPDSLTKSTHYANLGVLVPYQISQNVTLSVSWVYEQNSLTLEHANSSTGITSSVLKHNSSRVGVFTTGVSFRF